MQAPLAEAQSFPRTACCLRPHKSTTCRRMPDAATPAQALSLT